MAVSASVTQLEAPFIPVEVKVTFTTRQELAVFRKLMKADVRTPRMLEEDGDITSSQARTLQRTMHGVFMALQEYSA